jgi:DNA invertase Pin-like site-specific DNA recombinase
MDKAIALLRVSTQDQQLGLTAQRHDIEAYAEKHALEIAAWHVEVVSGGTPFERRPVLGAALSDVAARGAVALVVSKHDRLSRDPLVALLVERALGKLGAALLAADGANGSEPSAELLRGVLRSVALFERRLIGLRTKAALAAKRAAGEHVGRPRGRRESPASIARRAERGVRLGRPRAAGPAPGVVREARAAGRSWCEIAKAHACTVATARRRFAEATP